MAKKKELPHQFAAGEFLFVKDIRESGEDPGLILQNPGIFLARPGSSKNQTRVAQKRQPRLKSWNKGN